MSADPSRAGLATFQARVGPKMTDTLKNNSDEVGEQLK